MANIDIARRVYDHSWKLDPIVRSLIDTDFYKLLMLQMIWVLHPDVRGDVLADQPVEAIKLARGDRRKRAARPARPCRTLRLSKKEGIWLAGNAFYGETQIFRPEFLDLARRFPAARIRARGARATSMC